MGKDELICDLAETYGLFNYKGVPLSTLASLVVGLRDNSRIKMLIAGAVVDTQTLIIASILDKLSLLVWFNSQDGQKNINRPKSVVEALLNNENDTMLFNSIEEFEEYKQKLLGKE